VKSNIIKLRTIVIIFLITFSSDPAFSAQDTINKDETKKTNKNSTLIIPPHNRNIYGIHYNIT